MSSMSSIASAWRTRITGRRNDRSLSDMPVEDIAAGKEDAEYQLSAGRALNLLRRSLTGHQQAILVYNDMLEGYRPKETMARLNIDKLAYDAARKRISRAVQDIRYRLHNEYLERERKRLAVGEHAAPVSQKEGSGV